MPPQLSIELANSLPTETSRQPNPQVISHKQPQHLQQSLWENGSIINEAVFHVLSTLSPASSSPSFFNYSEKEVANINGDDDFSFFLLNHSQTDDAEVTKNQTNDTRALDIWWNVFDEQYLRHSLGWTFTLVTAYTLILIIGVIGNIMVILVVALRPQMRTVTNMFIMNLAVADLFVIWFCVPGTLVSNVFQPWILGSIMCKGVAYIQGVSVCASAYSLAAISLDRCKAIYHPLGRPRGLSKSQALSIICLIWVAALLVTLPWAVIFDVTRENDGLDYCVETWEDEQHGKIYFLVVNLICCYIIPLVIISASNVVIWCHVTHRKVPLESASAGTIKRMHRRTRNGVRRMLGIVTLAFLISWLPLYVLVTRVKFSSKSIGEAEENILYEILMPIAQLLGSWNSSINPVLYAFLNSKFREMFKSLLPSWIPFVHTGNSFITRHQVGRGTVTNGNFPGGLETASYTTVVTARSRGSSQISRRHKQRRNGCVNDQRAVLVSSFRSQHPEPSSPAPATTTAIFNEYGDVVVSKDTFPHAASTRSGLITDL